jgi:hypothetical protein
LAGGFDPISALQLEHKSEKIIPLKQMGMLMDFFMALEPNSGFKYINIQ